MGKLPTGTVTFMFSDIEGSTRLLQEHPDAYPAMLERQRELLRDAFRGEGGVEVETEGDSIFVVFPSAKGAVAAAAAGQRALHAEPWPDEVALRVRMGLVSGEAQVRGKGYVGLDVHRTARLAGGGHGGQVLLSDQTRGLVAGALPEGLAMRDLGEHRLKDLDAPERIWQLVIDGLPETFPPLRTAFAPPDTLPVSLTSFVGRAGEVDAVMRLLDGSRLVTLVGPGGVGKTRLALEVARRERGRFPDGVHFVPLAALREVELVLPAIAAQLGVPERGGRDPMKSLLEHLAARVALLVIDNFEHLQPAALDVAGLLAAPGVSMLVTSRAPLHVYGEQRFPVPALSLPGGAPDLDAAARSDAISLFVARAAAVVPDFALTSANASTIADICSRLDGLPLAIELAAARVGLLLPEAILANLGDRLGLRSGSRDVPARQQTLRDAIAWSHELLGPQEQTLFADLSVFAGGATLEAITAVCGRSAAGVLDDIGALVDGSLLRRLDRDGEPRFGMLDTIREYAAERLAAAGRTEDVRRRHADHFVGLVDRARPFLLGNEAGVWLDRLEFDHDNLRAVLSWAGERSDAALALRLTAGLWRFWQRRGFLVEGLARARAALALPGDSEPNLRADGYEAAGGLAYWQADAPTTRTMYEASLALRRQLGDERAIAEALYNLAFSYSWLTDPGSSAVEDMDAAQRALDEAHDLFGQLGDRTGVAKTLWGMAVGETWGLHLRESDAYNREALRLARELDDRFLVTWALYVDGINALGELELDQAEASLLEALGLFQGSDDVSGYTLVLEGLAALASGRGDRERAARICGAVAHLESATGTTLQRINRKVTRFDPGELQRDPALRDAWAEGAAMEVADAVAYALSS